MPDIEADEPVDDGVAESDDDHEDPRGTLVLMLLFLCLIALMWTWAYYSLIARG